MRQKQVIGKYKNQLKNGYSMTLNYEIIPAIIAQNQQELEQMLDKIKNFEILDLMQEANKITLAEHGNQITLERAIFLSWWCDKGDCLFCYMSSQKPKIKEPQKARRNINSILAEAELCRRTDWKIEFLSGGYGSFSTKEIKDISQRSVLHLQDILAGAKKNCFQSPSWILFIQMM